MSRAQRILAVIVGLITAVLRIESYGAMVTAARAGGRAIPELWPLGTEALALAMEVSVLEAKRLGHLTAGATPVWLLGSFAVLSLLYRAEADFGPRALPVGGMLLHSPATPGRLQDA